MEAERCGYAAQLHIDADPALFLARGIGTMGRSLIEGMAQRHPGLAITAHVSKDHPKMPWLDSMRAYNNFNLHILPWSHRQRNAFELLGISSGPKVKCADNVALLYLCPRVACRTGARQFCIVHDLSAFGARSHSSVPWHGAVMLWHALRSCTKQRATPVAVSRFTRDDLARHLGRNPDAISFIYQGIDADWFQLMAVEEVNGIKAKYSLPAEYFVWYGQINPRKNIDTLLRAYAAALKQARHYLPQLLLVGEEKQQVSSLIQELGITQSVVRIPTVIPLRDLVAIVSGCSAVVFPSWFEGFGRPAVEAAARGVPAIVSSTGALPEVAGPAALVVPPSAAAVAEALIRAAFDKNVAASSVRLGPVWAKQFRNEKMCDQFVATMFHAVLPTTPETTVPQAQ